MSYDVVAVIDFGPFVTNARAWQSELLELATPIARALADVGSVLVCVEQPPPATLASTVVHFGSFHEHRSYDADRCVVLAEFGARRLAACSTLATELAWARCRLDDALATTRQILAPALASADFAAAFRSWGGSVATRRGRKRLRPTTRRDLSVLEVRSGDKVWRLDRGELPAMRCVTNVDAVERICLYDLDRVRSIATKLLTSRDVIVVQAPNKARLEAFAIACCDQCVAAHFDVVWRVQSHDAQVPSGNRWLVWFESDGHTSFLRTHNSADAHEFRVLLHELTGSWLVDPMHAVLARFSTARYGPDSGLPNSLLPSGIRVEKGFALVAIFADDDGSFYIRLCVSPADLTAARELGVPLSAECTDSPVRLQLSRFGYPIGGSCRFVEREFRRVAAFHLDRTIAANFALHRSAVPDDQCIVILKYLREEFSL